MGLNLIGAIFLILSTSVWGKFLALDNIVYSPLKSVEDIHFTLKSEEFNTLIKSKLLLSEDIDLKFKIYKTSKDLDLELKGFEFKSEELKRSVKEIVLKKASHAWQSQLQDFLKELKFTKKEDNWYYYQDEVGALEIESLRLQFKNNTLTLVLKRNESKEEIKYIYKRKPWSSTKIVLSSIESILTQNSQVYSQSLIYIYKKHKFGLWLPERLEIYTDHRKVGMKPDQKHRVLSEVYQFSDYKFNQKFATNWFKSKI